MEPFCFLDTIHVQQLIDYLQFDEHKSSDSCTEAVGELGDLISTRVNRSENYTGSELEDALEDVPDVIDSVISRTLERQRDTKVVLISEVFRQTRQKGTEINLRVPLIEDQRFTNASHDFCNRVIQDPQSVIEQAPPSAFEDVETVRYATRTKQNLDRSRLEEENQQLRAEIQKKLDSNIQFLKLNEMIKEREIEIRGMKARLT